MVVRRKTIKPLIFTEDEKKIKSIVNKIDKESFLVGGI